MPGFPSPAPYPGYETPPLGGIVPVPGSVADQPGPDDSVVARDDHLEGTFTSRGTVHVMGSVKGRVEAQRLHVDDGARVEAEVIVDEAIIAGEFIGTLMCRQRLEARASGRLSGLIETYRVMLHEGASVEGEVRMLPEPGRAGVDTIRGSAHARGGLPRGAVPEGIVAAGRVEASPRARMAPEAPAGDGIADAAGEASLEVLPRTTPRSSARPASASPDTVQVGTDGTNAVGNGSHPGV
jgi:cytoskeletal protein CcmA (bactofilin family)